MARSRDEGPNAAMHYNEILARRIVAEVARVYSAMAAQCSLSCCMRSPAV
jgi:hypothetical protein